MMPSAPGGSWGGVAGVQKLIGVKALRKLEQEESSRVLKLTEKFINSKGAIIAFQKNAPILPGIFKTLRSAERISRR